MKYFVDFEATQFEQEIISVGCVSEFGDEFYSLVRPKHIKRVTGFITELTGISVAELKKAPDADAVFSDMYDQIEKDEKAEFYCYGNCDTHFIKCTLKYVNSFKAQCMLGLMYSSMTDVSHEFSEKFGTDQTISLYKLADRYGALSDRNHNALNDARILHHVYECFVEDDSDECPFPEYITRPKQKDDDQPVPAHAFAPNARLAANRGGDVHFFTSYGKAADWIMAEVMPKGVNVTGMTKSNISNRIVQAVSSGSHYHGYVWSKPSPDEKQ